MDPTVLYHDKDRVRVGSVVRYDIEVADLPQRLEHRSLFVRVRNTELVALRAAYLAGPYYLYCDMIPLDYDIEGKNDPIDEPKYHNHIKASGHFSIELKLPEKPFSGKRRFRITIVSEILFSRSAEVRFEITIGTTKHMAKLHGHSARSYYEKTGKTLSEELQFFVAKSDTTSIWQQPLPKPNEPLHVVVLTHGLVSNVTADMLFVKESIDAAARKTGENIVCKGYTGNVCRTEKGVKYLGKRLAKWLAEELIPTYKPAKLSFIAHSLGGPVQTYALGYVQAHYPHAFKDVELMNFMILASPMLGISNENPGYVQLALNFGVVGVTGLDLGLSRIPGVTKPLLEEIPNEHTMTVLRRFKYRTLYANAVNDGIVPLRTASLLYLDWRAIGRANAAHNDFEREKHSLHKRQHSSGKDGQMEVNKEEYELMQRRKSRESVRTNESVKTDPEKQDPETPTDPEKQLYRLDLESPKLESSKLESPKLESPKLESPKRESPKRESPKRESPKRESPKESRPPSRPVSPTYSDTSSVRSSQNSFSSFLFGHSRTGKIIKLSQTGGASEEDLDAVGEQLPRKTSLLESGMLLLMPPHPDSKFFMDPQSRYDAIFHDRVYYQQDLPERRFKSRLHVIKGYKEKVEVAKSEERIARQYHSGTSWRKVLVEMLPEAHNNIIVRRRFSNAYGWPVIEHLVREHFLHPAEIDERALAISQSMIGSSKEDEDYSVRSSAQQENVWSKSEDESEPDREIDPHRASMLKIIPTDEDGQDDGMDGESRDEKPAKELRP